MAKNTRGTAAKNVNVKNLKVRNTKSPKTAKTVVADQKVKKTKELKKEVVEVADDVSEKLKLEIEEIIAGNVDKAPVDSRLNKALRNAAIACAIILVSAIVWNLVS